MLNFHSPWHCTSDHNRLWGWVDTDYAGCQDTRRSHTGYVLMLNDAAISWRSQRQATVSQSSAESKFIAASQCGQEVVYLREILKGFGAEQDSCTRVFEDNQACTAMSENTVHRERSRHIDVRKYYVRELVEDKLIKADAVRHKGDDSRRLYEESAISLIQNAQKYDVRCHIATKDARNYIIACQCLLDMGIQKASGDGGV